MVEEAYSADKVRVSEETFSAPKRVIKVGSMTLQLRRKSAVNHGNATAFVEEIFDEGRGGGVSINVGSTHGFS